MITPERDSLIARLSRHAESDPHRDAIVTDGLSLSYAQLARQVEQKAMQLANAGVSSQSVVAVRCVEDADHLVLSLALVKLGATSLSPPTHDSRQALSSLMEQSGATHIAQAETIEAVSGGNASSASNNGEAILLFCTSGTTGEPKIVVLHDSDIVAQAHRHVESPAERFACLASMEHNFAKRHRLYCIATGATNVFVDTEQHALIEELLAMQTNVLHVTAFQARELLAAPDCESLSDIRLKLGGSHVPSQLRQQLRSRITDCLQAGYGTTETGAIAFTDSDDLEAGESVGRPLPGIDVRVLDDEGNAVDVDETGALAIRGAGMFRGYLNNPELTQSQLRNQWFFTGDAGHLDTEGRIHLSGRTDDMFTFNSMNIYPQDIESTLCGITGVRESLVVPQPSSVHGNIPIAYVVMEASSDTDLSAVKAKADNLLGPRCPRRFTRVDALPRSTGGKLLRKAADSLSQTNRQVRSLILDALSPEAKRRLRQSSIESFKRGDIDLRMRGAGLDSFARMEMLVAIELEYDVVITPEAFAEFETFGDVSAAVLSAMSGQNKPARSAAIPPQESCDDSRCLRLFHRVLRACPTVAQLNKALTTLEHRLTPHEFRTVQTDIERLTQSAQGAHNPAYVALINWANKVDLLMAGSGNSKPKPYQRIRAAPSVTHFVGPGNARDKKLLICFAPKAGRQLTVANAVLLQHTDATQYDVLTVADSARESYRTGIPLLGKNIDEVLSWIGNLDLLREYQAIRTIGCSAGAYMAVIAGYRLGAELAVSVAGRFHSERHPIRIFARYFSAWATARKHHCPNVIMSYPADKNTSRDRTYARLIGNLTNGHLLGVELIDDIAGHHFLQRLAQRGELGKFLQHTAFAALDNGQFGSEKTNAVLSFPAGTLRQAV